MTDNKCESCVYWGLSYGGMVEDNEVVLNGARRCGKTVQLWDASEWKEINGEMDRVPIEQYRNQMMFTQDGSDYKADLFTTPNFFCAHYDGG